MLRLRTFGGLCIANEQGPLAIAAGSRRRVALLPLLAAAGDAGLTRDKLLAFLWPDSDSERARHALAQTMYALRRELRDDSLFLSGPNEVKLNPAVLGSDIKDFDAALARSDYAGAVALYTGPFLDGFFISDAPEFERWVERQRSELANRARHAIEELAAIASTRGESAVAAAHWGKLAAMDPLNGRVALSYMRSLVAAGNRERAIQHARVHEALVRDELGATVDREVLEYAERLKTLAGRRVEPTPAETHDDRTGASNRRWQRTSSGARAMRDSVALAATATLPEIRAAARTLRRAILGRARRAMRRRPVRIALAASTSVLLLTVATLALRRHWPGSLTALDTRRLAIAVFENRTGDRELEPFGRVSAYWLGERLAELQLADVAEPRSALYSYDAVAESTSAGTPPDTHAFASEVGAGTIIRGEYTLEGDTISCEARAVDGRSGRTIASIAPVRLWRGEPMNVAAEVGRRLAMVLARVIDPSLGQWGQGFDTQPAYLAYSEFIAGISARPRSAREALMHFRQSFALDSSLLSTALWKADAEMALEEWPAADSTLTWLETHREQLGTYDRYVVRARRAELRGDFAGYYEQAHLAFAEEPKWDSAKLRAADAALRINRPREAARLLRELDPARGELRGWTHYWWMLTSADHMLGEFEEELADARRGALQYPTQMTVRANEVRALAALGRIEELEQRLETNRELRSWGYFDRFRTLSIAMGELLAHNHGEAAQRLLARADSWYRVLPPDERQSGRHDFEYAHIMYYAGRYKESRALFERVLATDTSNLFFLGFVGISAGRAGDTREADRIASVLQQTHQPYLFGVTTMSRAQIAAVLGDRALAVQLMRRAFAEGREYTVYTHIDLGSELLRGYPPYQELMKPKG